MIIRVLMTVSVAAALLLGTTGCWAFSTEKEPFEALCLTGTRLGSDTFAVHTNDGGFITVRRDGQQLFHLEEGGEETQFVSFTGLEEVAGVEIARRDDCVENKQPK